MATKTLALLLCGMVICTALAVRALLNESRVNARQAARIVQLESLHQAAPQPAASLPGASPPAPVPCPQRVSAPASPSPAAAEAALRQAAAIGRLTAALEQANASIAELTGRIGKLQSQLEEAVSGNQRLAAAEAGLNENLASANRRIDAQRRELNVAAARMAQLETTNQDLRRQADAAGGKLSQLAAVSARLEDVQRRREDLLHTILRRYKDVAEQYRALDGTPAEAGASLERIHSAVSLADDELGQLDVLTAQAGRLQKQLAGK